ncbi:MAG: hypothetical protein JO197_23055 [Acidobacteria bacterium]|nr:hypothetical protein [Acidobacteriota bacterium]MBV9477913.1 hypothetical protein [Acidobacteriota bacterium]
MRRSFALLALVLVAVSCASSSDDEPRPMPRRGGGMGMRGGARFGDGSVLEMLPPRDWWHDPQLAAPVNLTSEQMASLDRLSAAQGDDAAKLERDSMVAVRDLRTQLDAEQPASADILAAAKRVEALHDALFDKQAELLAAERTLLSQQQWASLQRALAGTRDDSFDRGGRGDRGGMRGRGGRGGRGRFPG